MLTNTIVMHYLISFCLKEFFFLQCSYEIQVNKSFQMTGMIYFAFRESFPFDYCVKSVFDFVVENKYFSSDYQYKLKKIDK